MENRKVSIRQWTKLQVVPAICLLVNYYMSVQWLDTTSAEADLRMNLIRLAIMLLIIAALLLVRRKRDVMDESAKQVIDRANALSFKWFFMYSGAVALGASMIVENAKIIGYFIAGGFVATSIVRAVIVHVLDSRGMM